MLQSAPSSGGNNPPATQSPAASTGQVSLALSAKFGKDLPVITSGLYWRIYSAKFEQGAVRPVKEDKAATPTVMLPPGTYVVHVAFGLASATKAVQLRPGEPLREVFEIPAGGLRIEGKVGDVRIPHGQISFNLYKGSQFEPGDKRPIVQGAQTGDVILVPEGTYHIESNYGDVNATVRSDIRVQAGKLTDATVTHRAAVITLKLVNEWGGEARANTKWSVLTPGGDVIKESIGAFPRVILAEGEYRVIARNDDQTYDRAFKVITGVDGEIEVLAHH
jgi:major membrane immunogen (membrane-anchored lipoprotein)